MLFNLSQFHECPHFTERRLHRSSGSLLICAIHHHKQHDPKKEIKRKRSDQTKSGLYCCKDVSPSSYLSSGLPHSEVLSLILFPIRLLNLTKKRGTFSEVRTYYCMTIVSACGLRLDCVATLWFISKAKAWNDALAKVRWTVSILIERIFSFTTPPIVPPWEALCRNIEAKREKPYIENLPRPETRREVTRGCSLFSGTTTSGNWRELQWREWVEKGIYFATSSRGKSCYVPPF